jgi:Outer membrane protein beta-barrel domain
VKHVFVLTALVGVLGATTAQAQDRGGVRVGVNLATLAVDDDDEGFFDTKNRTGLVVGLYGVVPVNDIFAFQPEVLFSQQGAKAEEGGNEATLKLDYVQIPALARIRLGRTSPAFLLVGPTFGFNTRAESEFDDETEDIDEDVKGSDVGLVTGVAINAGLAVIDARYTWGLMNINDATDFGNVKNRVFSFSVGLRF